jgi:hypothetical protein
MEEIWTESKLDKIHTLIKSKDTKNHYLATCLLRQSKDLAVSKELISKIPVSSRINSLKDICEEGNFTLDILPYKNAVTPLEKYVNACILIPKIVSVYNEGWEPNWNKSDEYKYFPYFEKKGSVWLVSDYYYWDASSLLPGSHYYKNRGILMDSCKKFQDTYNDWLNYVK